MNKVVTFSLHKTNLILILLLTILITGIFSFMHLNIEAYPDPVPPQVNINTQSFGQSAEEIERYITIPIEVQMAGIPNVQSIRTISLFGMSDVKIQFDYTFSYTQAEQWVINRLSQLSELPNNAKPAISPWSPTGEIFRYELTRPAGYSLTDLKTIQDWILERKFRSVPGVIDVTSWGGKTKTFEVAIDREKLITYGLTIPQILQVINESNINVGGQTVNIGPQAAVVRGIGLIHTIEDIGNTMVKERNGTPIFLSDIASITVSNKPRLGIAGTDETDDVVQGIVLMRRGEQSLPTIELVKTKAKEINDSNLLPPGVKIKTVYDRGDLIKQTTKTVLHNIMFGIILIFILQWAFLGNLRSAIIVATTIPFALAFAVTLMVIRGESANLLSVGAIDFGLIVDSTVIIVENIFRHLSQKPKDRFKHSELVQHSHLNRILSGKALVIANSALEVNKGIFFSVAIILTGFLPLFTLTGIEGHIFGPMAKTYCYAILGGLLATFTVAPALSNVMLSDKIDEKETFLVHALRKIYTPVIKFALNNKILILIATGILLTLTIFMMKSLGNEFLPKLEEGNIWIRATMPTSISLEEGNLYVNKIRKVIKSYPEIQTVISQHGRPDDGTDPTGFFNAEFFVPLKPIEEWTKDLDKNQLTENIQKNLEEQFPGIDFDFSQYIQDNVQEASSGVKGENSIKVFGNDLATLEKIAQNIKKTLSHINGVTDLGVLNSLGQPSVNIKIDRKKAARFGLTTGEINDTVAAAIGGKESGNVYEASSDRNFPIVVRLSSEYRKNLDTIRRITIGATDPDTGEIIQIPLSDVADVNLASGASLIYRENQERYIPIKFGVRGRDLGSVVMEAQEKVASEIKLPPGIHLQWVGQFSNLKAAMARLSLVVPLSILLICLLLYANFSSLTDTLLAASVIPMAIIGGIIALYITNTPFSVSAAIGFVALFGIAVMDGILVISYFNQYYENEDGHDRLSSLLKACQVQMRPVTMTCIVACVGLLPAAISTGIGSQVQKPLALVVVGGIILAPVLILIILPVLIDIFSRRKPKKPNTSSSIDSNDEELYDI